MIIILTTRQYSIAVAPMEPEGLNLAVCHDDQSSVLETIAYLGRSDDFDTSHRNVGRERLDLLDYDRTDFVLGVGRLRVYGFDDFAVVRANEEHVVGLATGSFNLRIDSYLSEPVAEER